MGELYWNQQLSIPKIAKRIGMPKTNVEYWMKKHRIPRRGLLKYPRLPFDGTPSERAYIFGFRWGDLYAAPSGKGIVVSTTTTHPAMVELFRKTFSKYGHVYLHPTYNAGKDSYQWCLKVLLDLSFSFLLRRSDRLPLWITEETSIFSHFLAGLFDAEGSIEIVFRERYRRWKVTQITLSLHNSDKNLLQSIIAHLPHLHPRMVLTYRGGTSTSYGGLIRKRDQWRIEIIRRAEAEGLLTSLPLAHGEKVERARLALDIFRGCPWQDARVRFEAIRKRVKEDVTEFSQRARYELGNDS